MFDALHPGIGTGRWVVIARRCSPLSDNDNGDNFPIYSGRGLSQDYKDACPK